MSNRYDTSVDTGTRLTRIAWLTAFFATIALIALLGVARSAQALPIPAADGVEAGAAPPPADEPEEEGEEASEELAGEECEASEEEDEGEGEEAEGCEAGSTSLAPPQCLVNSTTATVSANVAANKVRLVVHYTAVSPATVEIAYWLRGGKGPLTMAGDKKHFGMHGVFRDTEIMSESQMAKVMAAKGFTVRLRPLNAPGYCRSFLESHLTARRAAPGGLTWSDPESSIPAAHKH